MTPSPELLQFIKKRLDDMYDRPEMWAHSKEGFGLQLALLAELAGFDDTPMQAIFGPGPSVPSDEITIEWAQRAVTMVRTLIWPPVVTCE